MGGDSYNFEVWLEVGGDLEMFQLEGRGGEEKKMADNGEAWLVENLQGGLIKFYSDGSVVRAEQEFAPPPNPTDDYNCVPYKDIVFDHKLELWARVYLPPETKSRVPVLVYYHGGGFCYPVTPAAGNIHYMCKKWAATLGVMIVSADYRLAPEHRLPAAYHDAIAALQWIDSLKRESGSGGGGGGGVAEAAESEVDPWFHSHADFSKVFVEGESAGGNIAHHVGMWAAGAGSGNLQIQIKGIILVYPFFGGEERTPSEKQNSSVFTLEMSDAMWRLALPLGSNRDHPFCNPVGESGESCRIALPPLLFVIAGRDILKDKNLQYCESLKACGKLQVEVHMFEEEDHGFTVVKMEDQCSFQALDSISNFIKQNSQGVSQ